MHHERFLRMAIRLSERNVRDASGGPFGAVIVKDGKVVAKSANRVTASGDPTAHAEVSAIRKAAKKLKTFDLSGCILYTSCEPCPMCLGAIYWSRIGQLFFAASQSDAAGSGFSDAFIYQELRKPHSRRSLKTTQLLATEARKAFAEWTNSTIKINY